jgi:hypothetical protein
VARLGSVELRVCLVEVEPRASQAYADTGPFMGKGGSQLRRRGGSHKRPRPARGIAPWDPVPRPIPARRQRGECRSESSYHGAFTTLKSRNRALLRWAKTPTSRGPSAPLTSASPILVQLLPSLLEYPVNRAPCRCSLSQHGQLV